MSSCQTQLPILNSYVLIFSDKSRPYLIVKAVVRLSDPAVMDLVLRKRISFNVYKRHSITDKIRRKMGHTSNLASLGVTYEIVSIIPKVIQLIFCCSILPTNNNFCPSSHRILVFCKIPKDFHGFSNWTYKADHMVGFQPPEVDLSGANYRLQIWSYFSKANFHIIPNSVVTKEKWFYCF